MIDLNQIFNWLGQLHPIVNLVLNILGTLVVLATVYVKLTPNKEDDAWFKKLESLPVVGPIIHTIMNFSYVQRKDSKELQKK